MMAPLLYILYFKFTDQFYNILPYCLSSLMIYVIQLLQNFGEMKNTGKLSFIILYTYNLIPTAKL